MKLPRSKPKSRFYFRSMPDPQRTTPIGLARYARDYYETAVAAEMQLTERKGYEIGTMPAIHLICHSIELALKAYLLYRDVSLSDLIRLGHDLEKCWDSAVEHDVENLVVLSAADKGVMELANFLHKSTELRYIVTGSKLMPSHPLLESVAEKVLDAICPYVGYR